MSNRLSTDDTSGHAAPGVGPDASAAGPRRVISLAARAALLVQPATQRHLLADLTLAGATSSDASFAADLAAHGCPALRPDALEILQINLGKLCNMTCRHCHVDAGPDRGDAIMRRETVDDCLVALDRSTAHTVDLTGGAPEMNPSFEYLVDRVVARGKRLIDRCNLTILLVARYRHLPGWLAERGVELVCSLPHHRPRNTDAQRGNGAFARSIEALRLLNQAGYGHGDPRRRLSLVTNPAGAFLAGRQCSLEPEWKQTLAYHHGVTFDQLISLNNMPIARFLEWLVESGNLGRYMARLVTMFNPATIAGLMCRNTLSVSWDGRLYDCDFNQMLDLPVRAADGHPVHIRDFDQAALAGRRIRTERHCYGCTAGAGSSCGGTLAE